MSAITEPSVEQIATASYDAILVRIERQMAETRKFVAEQNKLTEEALKMGRDRSLAPWSVIATVFGAGTALLIAGGTVAKLFLS